MKEIKNKLKERKELIDSGNYQGKDIIILDESIKQLFENSEEGLKALRKVFKDFQKKNARKVEAEEIKARSENVDLLRKNLNLLLSEKENQEK